MYVCNYIRIYTKLLLDTSILLLLFNISNSFSIQFTTDTSFGNVFNNPLVLIYFICSYIRNKENLPTSS